MGISEKVMEALKAGILLNERVATLIDKVNRMDHDIRHINERLIRLETLVEISDHQQSWGYEDGPAKGPGPRSAGGR